MVRQIMISLAMLMIISSCKAQNTDNNNIKKNKNMERTTERFDTSTYYMERQGHEYQFEHYLRGKVRQFGGDNGSEFVNGEEKAESRSVFEKAVKVLSIGLRCIRLYSPRQNGKVERSNKGTAKFYIIVRLISEEKLIEQI